ncbi:hypothetical protein [Paenibacillus terrae]|uniref:Uncharacterized protein n=1 Tax=Paenibacillus terrae TaxID=159743 RepID=A0A0D7WXS3_9BACL|nr:hypothetical protein [Paenibacillus terrae]KJD43970.1 hypothetical protein QD47_19345 [Paenibacillus terrae]
MTNITAGCIIVTENACRYLIVSTSGNPMISELQYKIIDIDQWELSEPTYGSIQELIQSFDGNNHKVIKTIIKEGEVLSNMSWISNFPSNFSEKESGPFLIVIKKGNTYEYLSDCNGEEAYTDDIEEAKFFDSLDIIPNLRLDESIQSANHFLLVRKVSIQGMGYVYNFATNATKTILEEVMESVTCTVIGYCDSDIVPALKKSGYYALEIHEPVGDPDQIISADW